MTRSGHKIEWLAIMPFCIPDFFHISFSLVLVMLIFITAKLASKENVLSTLFFW